jgi:hypothetical protein
MSYSDEAQAIWREFVPASGQAATVQGELLRAVEKLRSEAIRNGNVNWDRGFRILLGYLRKHLLDRAVFSAAQRRQTRKILWRLGFAMFPVLDDEPYDRLADRVVDWHRHYGSKPHPQNPELRR